MANPIIMTPSRRKLAANEPGSGPDVHQNQARETQTHAKAAA
jgi:hypothetical protein